MTRQGEALGPSGSSRGAGNPYVISVDYNRSFKEAVKASRCDWFDSQISSFSSPATRKGTAEVKIELIHFDEDISTNEVLHDLDRMGLRPADLHELLAFGEGYPDISLRFPVVGLGSVGLGWHEESIVPYLFQAVGRIEQIALYCMETDYIWGPDCRFAAVRRAV
ncbi:MAG: Uncharacterized protein G01um1014107_194 [Parcubacteria group bacterium Gr01-1014_107]|nr:MAG: Uncharacterized protein G01um1014107_194 [Parcubacteria group bacterium Gr01-1014_107]